MSPVSEVAAPRVVALSRGQRRVWLAAQLDHGGRAFRIPVCLRLRGALRLDALRRALAEIVARHEVLRTGVVTVDDEPAGVPLPASTFELAVTDLSAAGEPPDIVTLVEAETAAPAGDLPIRAALFTLGAEDHLLCVTVHHVAFDGWSTQVFHDELAALYGAFAAGEPSPLAPVAAQYPELAADAERRQSGPDGARLARGLDFWRRELAGLPQFELSADHPRPASRDGRATCASFTVPAEVVAGLEALARGQYATLYTVLLAASQLLCHRYTGATDVVVGTGSAERDRPEVARAIGLFLNMLVLRGDLSGEPTVAELVTRVRDRMFAAYDHRYVPFETLVEELAPERDLARTPLFGILVELLPGVDTAPALAGLRTSVPSLPRTSAVYDVEFQFSRTADGLECLVVGDLGLYEPDTVRRWAGHLRALLVAMAGDAARRVADIPLLSAAEVAGLRAATTPAPVEFPRRCLHELFAERAAATPGAVAVVDDDRSLTYRELDEASDRFAADLLAYGLDAEAVVGVLVDRDSRLAVTVLGIMKAGAAFLPLDTETPPARVARLLTSAQAALCVVRPDLVGVVSDAGVRPVPVPGGTRPAIVDRALPTVDPDQLCSVYCTSGSTGEPKRVANTHAGWVNRMCWMQRRHGLRPGETVLHKTSLTFDDAAVELLWPLLVGGRVAMLAPGLHRDPRAIVRAGIRHRAVHLNTVPSMLELILDTLTGEDVAAWPDLRSVLSSGEALRPELVRRFRARFPDDGRAVSLDNTWGATEVSIDSTCHTCTAGDTGGQGAVSLGTPIDNNQVHVLDGALRPVPVGASGELYIGGVGLARGYLRDPRRTAEAFVPHPTEPGQRLYRTGDIGLMRPDGSFTFFGRQDHQVKIRGIRVELGEIEAVLREYRGVRDAVADVWDAGPGDRRVAAYVVLADPVADLAELRGYLTAHLPAHAVPSALVPVAGLPRLPSGKLDRQALPAPDPRHVASVAYVPPRTATEEAVAEIWSEALTLPRVGATDDFFALGGHSLLAVRVTNRSSRVFDVDLPAALIFQQRTVAGVAARIEELVLADVDQLSDAEAAALLAAAPD